MRYSSKLDIDLNKLISNFDKLSSRLNNNEIIFMVKANAYGHGIFEIVEFCYKNCAIKNFGVASLKEAVLIRERLPFVKADIYVFSDCEIEDADKIKYYIEYNIRPVISNLNDLNKICSNSEFNNLPLVIKYNTGMNRLGIDIEDLEKSVDILKKYNKKTVNHLMSHFSSAYLKLTENCMTYKQIEKFNMVKKFLKDNGIEIEHTSMANSSAIEKGIMLEETHVRPGIMLYGPQSSMTGESIWNGEIISKYYTKIINKFKITKNETFGYGNFSLGNSGTIVILGIGYGDGFHTSYSGKEIYLDEYKGTVVGRVNMDLIYVYFSEDPGLKVDQIVYLWNHEQKSIARLEKSLQTISYELFCSLSIRIPRCYSLN